jgi:hypothetical protein
MTDHTDLIARVIAGPGSRELSDEVARALGWRTWNGSNVICWQLGNGTVHWHHAPDYSQSIDAAVTAIPAGWRWSAGNDHSYSDPLISCWARVFPAREMYKGTGNQYGATPMLALCVAILRARMQP